MIQHDSAHPFFSCGRQLVLQLRVVRSGGTGKDDMEVGENEDVLRWKSS